MFPYQYPVTPILYIPRNNFDQNLKYIYMLMSMSPQISKNLNGNIGGWIIHRKGKQLNFVVFLTLKSCQNNIVYLLAVLLKK